MINSLLEIGSKLIDKIIPDKQAADAAKLKLLQLQQDVELKIEEFKHQEAIAQMDINKTEAQSEHIFISGWRPFIGWVCGIGLCYQFLLQPLLLGLFDLPMPSLDVSTLVALVTSMLGFGWYRSMDKRRK